MQPSRTIDSIISGPRQGSYVPLAKSIFGIVHNPERALGAAYSSITKSSEFNEKMLQIRLPGNPVSEAGLTEEEKTAILLYTFKTTDENTSFSATINKALSSRSDVIRELRGFLLHMLSGLRRLKRLPPQTPAYHAVSSGYIPFDLLGYVPGRTVVWSSFVSVTPDADFLRAKARPGTVVFEVSGEGATAYDITPFAFTREGRQMNEFLLEPDTKFKVDSIERNSPMFNGATLVRLRSEGIECICSPIFSTIIEEFRNNAKKNLSKSGVPLVINSSKMRFNPDKVSLPEVSSLFVSMSSTAYTSIRDAVISAEFSGGKTKEEREKNADDLIGHCRETLSYLKKKGILERYKMTEEQAVAIIIFTFDYGSESEKVNPCYKVNRILGTRNTNEFHKMRPFILHLLSGLRKLPRVDTKTPLYRGINGAKIRPVEKHYQVGSKRGWVAFTSTCYDPDCAEDFTTGDFPVLFKITGDYIGYDITEFSLFNEPEVLIEPETTFTVEKVTHDGDGVACITVKVEHSEPIIADIVRNFENNSRTSHNTNTVLPPQPKKQLKQNAQQPFMVAYQQQMQQYQQVQPQQPQPQPQQQQQQPQCSQQQYQQQPQPQQQYQQQPQCSQQPQPQQQYQQQPQYSQQPQQQYQQQRQLQYPQQPQQQSQQPQLQYPQQPQYSQQQQQQQYQQQLQLELTKCEMSHFAKLVESIFPQSELQRYSTIQGFCEGVSKGEVPLANDPNLFVKLTESFLKVIAQYRSEIYARFSSVDPKILDWQYVNFFSAYLILSEAMYRKLNSETFIEICLTPGKFIADEKAAIGWTSLVQRKISLRYPSGSLKLPPNTKDSIRAFTRSRVWFFMPTNAKNPKELVNKIKSRPDFVSSCYFSARLYDPVNVIVSFQMQEICDPKSIFSMYRCPIDDSSAMCGVMIKYMGLHNVKPLNIVRMQNGNQNVVSFRLTLSTPEDIPQLKRTFRGLYECPIVKVELSDRGAEILKVLAECPGCVPLSIVPSSDGSLVVTFFDESMCREFCVRYKQKCTRVNELTKKVSVAHSTAPLQLYPPVSGAAPRNPSNTINVTRGNSGAATNYGSTQSNCQPYPYQSPTGSAQQQSHSPPTSNVTLGVYFSPPYNGTQQNYRSSPPPVVGFQQPPPSVCAHQRYQSPPPSQQGNYQKPQHQQYNQQQQQVYQQYQGFQQPPRQQQEYPMPQSQAYQSPPQQQQMYSMSQQPLGNPQMQPYGYTQQYRN